MEKSKLEYSLKLYTDAVNRFAEAVGRSPSGDDDIIVDASIQRFEFSYEMTWKTLKRFLEHKGITTKTPRDSFKQAFKLGWLSADDDLWANMITDRNRTSHTYDRNIAQQVYKNLPGYLTAYQELLEQLKALLP